MDKRSSKRKKKAHDFAVTAFRVVQEATAELDAAQAVEESPLNLKGKNPNAVALGRLGGQKGGMARTLKLTPEQRSEIARRAALKRWGRPPPTP